MYQKGFQVDSKRKGMGKTTLLNAYLLHHYENGSLQVGPTVGRRRAIGHFGIIASIRFPDLHIVNLMLKYNLKNWGIANRMRK